MSARTDGGIQLSYRNRFTVAFTGLLMALGVVFVPASVASAAVPTSGYQTKIPKVDQTHSWALVGTTVAAPKLNCNKKTLGSVLPIAQVGKTGVGVRSTCVKKASQYVVVSEGILLINNKVRSLPAGHPVIAGDVLTVHLVQNEPTPQLPTKLQIDNITRGWYYTTDRDDNEVIGVQLNQTAKVVVKRSGKPSLVEGKVSFSGTWAETQLGSPLAPQQKIGVLAKVTTVVISAHPERPGFAGAFDVLQ